MCGTDQSCPLCRYDLTATPDESPCPECGAPCSERARYTVNRLRYACVRFRVYATLCMPAWLFAAFEAVGQYTAFVFLGLPRQHIQTGQEPLLDALLEVWPLVLLPLPLNALAFLLLPVVLWDEARRRRPARPRPARFLLAFVLIVPACGIVLLLVNGPMLDIGGWIPD